MKKTVIDVAKEVLKNNNEPLNPNRMYRMAEESGLTKDLNLKGKTPWDSFSARIYVDIKNNPNTIFEIIDGTKPMLIKLKGQYIQDKDIKTQHIKIDEPKISYKEKDLHPLLSRFTFANENFKAYTRTIRHEISIKSKKGVNKWLYPDMVGVSFEYKDYEVDLIDFINKFSVLPIKIYAFEIKRYLNVASFRESYFQAVSNSSWANEGYLVALDIDESDEELMNLIKRLNFSFGIGVLSINSQNVDESVILARAKFRENLDYSVIHTLSSNNQDFHQFLESVKDFDVKKDHRSKSEFDEVLSDDKLDIYLKDKKIVKKTLHDEVDIS